MTKKLGFAIILMLMYIYTLTFNIFLTSIIRVPAPIVFCLPLVLLLSDPVNDHFRYTREVLVFFFAALLYFLIGEQNITGFLSAMITIGCCALYFNSFVGSDLKLFNLSIWMFYLSLAFSAVILGIDRQFQIPEIRSFLAGEPVIQSPSGIASAIFSFGYQLAVLTTFLAVAVALYSKSFIAHLLSTALCVVLIFYGMQRSALIAFGIALAVFWIYYYRYQSLLIVGVIAVAGLFLSQHLDSFSSGKQQNILSKNEKNKHAGENREGLMMENFEIISDYPLGLMVAGKSWNEVVKHNFVYKDGDHVISSHNAYLMFITYVGIIPGLALFYLIYSKIVSIIWAALKHIRDKENALLVCLCVSFVAVSINSFFHNGWLLAGNGPTLFLYFSILHLDRIRKERVNAIAVTPRKSTVVARQPQSPVLEIYSAT